MKNKLILASSIALFALSSCKKDRTCECTTTSTSTYISPGNPTITSTPAPSTAKTEYKKVKKSSIQIQCGDSKYSSTSNDSGISNTYSSETKCTIK